MVLVKPTLATLALVSLTGASPIAQGGANSSLEHSAQNCGLSAYDPKSWAASGAEKMLGDFLDKNGPANWLQAISDAEMGPNTIAIDCAHTSSNSCRAPEGAADCDKYGYFFIRTMAAQVNAAFKSIQDNLQVQTIKDALKVDTIIKDFDVLKPPEGSKTPSLLRNIAIGPALISTFLGLAPGGAYGGALFSVIAAAISATAGNLGDNKQLPELPEYKDLAAAMNERLGGFFGDTQSTLEKTLLAIFGDSSLSEADATKIVRDMVERMSGLGVKNLNKDAKSPVAEILKSGEWLSKVQSGMIDEGMKKAFATTRQGLIGNLLATMHVYVEQELPAYNEGLVQPCTALGTLREGNSCLVIKRKPFDGGDLLPLEDKHLRRMGDYGIDLHALIRNVRDCNNGAVDNKQLLTDGSLPRCFFGMNFAQRVHKKDRDFYTYMVNKCVSDYKPREGVPDWIRGPCEIEIPKWKPCKVKFEETGVWTEGWLDRYRMGMIGEDVDISQICPYAYDGRRCVGSSNRQCYFNDVLKMWVFDVNFAKGSLGHDSYKSCRDDIRSSYARDNRCEAV